MHILMLFAKNKKNEFWMSEIIYIFHVLYILFLGWLSSYWQTGRKTTRFSQTKPETIWGNSFFFCKQKNKNNVIENKITENIFFS